MLGIRGGDAAVNDTQDVIRMVASRNNSYDVPAHRGATGSVDQDGFA